MKKAGFNRYWEMREGAKAQKEVFRCVDCGAVSRPENGWNGEPNRHQCSPGCRCSFGDVRVSATDAYRKNYDAIRWDNANQT